MIYITNYVDGATVKCGIVVLLPRDGAALGFTAYFAYTTNCLLFGAFKS